MLWRIVALSIVAVARAIELTFELPDNAKECFFEEIKADVECVFEYQVPFCCKLTASCLEVLKTA